MLSRSPFHAASNGSTPEAVTCLVPALDPPLRYKNINFPTNPEHPSPTTPTSGLSMPACPLRRFS